MTTAKTARRTPPRKQEPARPERHAPPRGSGGRRAAAGVDEGTRLEVPVLGTVTFPPRDQLIFVGGVGLLAVVGLIEWPVAAVVRGGSSVGRQT